MKLSSNGYYIESYDKCTVCGKLIYEGEEIVQEKQENKNALYCSEWCIDWEKSRKVK